MSDELLIYYNRELTYFRQLASKFAEQHPKIAERLRLGPDAAEDPHVERLIEAFAYLTARVRHKLDDEFPELTGSMLDVLYPHYQAPIPSMAIVQFQLDPEQVQLTTGQRLARHTELETETLQGETCLFRTCYPVTLWPLEVRQAGLTRAPFVAPDTPYSAEAVNLLRLSLGVQTPDLNIAELGIRSLRFFIKAQPQHAFRLYELIFNNTLGVALAGSPSDRRPVALGRDCLEPVGFGREEGMLPYPARSFLGYRLLTEYFAFPQKYLFFDVNLPPLGDLDRFGSQLDLYLYFNRSFPELGRVVSAETFQLGCAPVVNLYRQRAEPIPLTQTRSEYQVVPDKRLPMTHEVYAVERVVASPPSGDPVEFLPFFSVKHTQARNTSGTFWHASRRPAEATAALGDRGTDVFLSLVDLGFQPSVPADWTLGVETTCLNRDRPEDLPFGGDQPRMQFREGKGFVSRISCLTAPTPTLRPPLRHGLLWRLISHLSLNHLSLVDDPRGESLREILKLYDFTDSDETRNQIEGILSVESARVVGSPRTGGPVSFCRGMEVRIEFDEDRFTASGLFLFASVLERFLALHTTINSFTKLVARVKGRKEELRRWPPRVGENVLA